MTDQLEDRQQRRQISSSHPLQTIPVTTKPYGNIPNTPLAAAIIAFLLGAVCALGALTFLIGGFASNWWSTYQLGFFVASWAIFHWAEFAVTAGWNLEKCSINSFLLDNGALYHVANGTAMTEYLLSLYFWPHSKSNHSVSAIGVLMVFFGQVLRSAAMVHASTNFSHLLATYKRKSHKLVTNGVYAWFRHPAYAGFFYWALGTQLVLQNPLSFVLFSILLWRFFYYRTREEERDLIAFFGDEYIQYRRRVGTRLPFIP